MVIRTLHSTQNVGVPRFYTVPMTVLFSEPFLMIPIAFGPRADPPITYFLIFLHSAKRPLSPTFYFPALKMLPVHKRAFPPTFCHCFFGEETSRRFSEESNLWCPLDPRYWPADSLFEPRQEFPLHMLCCFIPNTFLYSINYCHTGTESQTCKSVTPRSLAWFFFSLDKSPWHATCPVPVQGFQAVVHLIRTSCGSTISLFLNFSQVNAIQVC